MDIFIKPLTDNHGKLFWVIYRLGELENPVAILSNDTWNRLQEDAQVYRDETSKPKLPNDN